MQIAYVWYGVKEANNLRHSPHAYNINFSSAWMCKSVLSFHGCLFGPSLYDKVSCLILLWAQWLSSDHQISEINLSPYVLVIVVITWTLAPHYVSRVDSNFVHKDACLESNWLMYKLQFCWSSFCGVLLRYSLSVVPFFVSFFTFFLGFFFLFIVGRFVFESIWSVIFFKSISCFNLLPA